MIAPRSVACASPGAAQSSEAVAWVQLAADSLHGRRIPYTSYVLAVSSATCSVMLADCTTAPAGMPERAQRIRQDLSLPPPSSPSALHAASSPKFAVAAASRISVSVEPAYESTPFWNDTVLIVTSPSAFAEQAEPTSAKPMSSQRESR